MRCLVDSLTERLIPDAVEEATFDPAPPHGVPVRHWWGHHLRELRWQAELAQLLASRTYRGEGVARGHGEPVMAIPGFLAGDSSLSVLRGWLGRMGYAPYGTAIQLNVDCSERAVRRLERRLERLNLRHRRPVALIGHSRGGHFAKVLAQRHPELVSCVVSMGAGLDTPYDISLPTKAAVAAVRAVHTHTTDRVAQNGCFTSSCRCRFGSDYAASFPSEVPLTSVYTRRDGVVWWEACVVPYADNVEVDSTHVGLGFNRYAYRAIGEALSFARAAAADREPPRTTMVSSG
jgi:pimeloyl-ACP methyl ester carboxylesterase